MFPTPNVGGCFGGPPRWQDVLGFNNPFGLFMSSNGPYCADEAIKESLKILQSEQFKGYYRKYEDEIQKIISQKTKTEELLAKGLPVMLDRASARDVEAKMAESIGMSRTNLIKNSFTIETYKMIIEEGRGRVPYVRTLRAGAEFLPSVKLSSKANVEEVTTTQIISLVIEIFFFILSVIGIRAHLDEMEMRAAMRAAGEVVGTSQFQRALQTFIEEWERGGRWRRAKAIFYFLKDGVPLSAFWKIIKAVLTEMSAWEYIKAAAEITALIVVTFATDGAALIAKIFLALNDAVAIERKVSNIIKLNAIKI